MTPIFGVSDDGTDIMKPNVEIPIASEPLESPATEPIDSDETDWLELLIVAAKYKKVIATITSACALLAIVTALLLPNTYTGTARIMPPQQSQSVASAVLGQLGAASMLTRDIGLKNPSDLFVTMLQSRSISDALVTRFDLMRTYKASRRTDAQQELETRTHVAAGREGIITISVEDKDPKQAAALTNAYVEELYRLSQNLAVTEASQRRAFFDKQLQAEKEDLTQAEIAFKQVQEQTGLIQLDAQAKTIVESVAQLRARVAAKEVQINAMRSFATDRNPDLILAEQELAGLRAQTAQLERSTSMGGGNIQVPTGKIPQAGLEYVRRMRDLKYHETMFELLAKQLEIAKVDEAKSAPVIQVMDRAVEPEKKSGPPRTLIVLITTLCAFLMSLAAVWVFEAIMRENQNPRHHARLDLLRKYLTT